MPGRNGWPRISVPICGRCDQPAGQSKGLASQASRRFQGAQGWLFNHGVGHPERYAPCARRNPLLGQEGTLQAPEDEPTFLAVFPKGLPARGRRLLLDGAGRREPDLAGRTGREAWFNRLGTLAVRLRELDEELATEVGQPQDEFHREVARLLEDLKGEEE